MIIFVSTYTHQDTHRDVAKSLPFFRQTSYLSLLARRSLPWATYIFSDFDRLGFWQLELAGHVYQHLRTAGVRVLNDPARALQRLALLRALNRQGINSFAAWAAVDAAMVDRFPVFIRTAAAHRGNLTELIHDPTALALHLEQLTSQGYPLANLIIIEYRAEPFEDDVFRKLAIYRVGDRMIPVPSVHERHWTVKHGQEGVAGEAAYGEDLQRIKTNPYAATLRQAFDAANIDYGRADFAIVKGRPEIYEINTNPFIGGVSTRHFASRIEAGRLSRAGYDAALLALDTPERRGRIRIPPAPPLRVRLRRFLPFRGYQWLP